MTEVAFAQSGDVSIAYRVVGGGPVDLVYAGVAYRADALEVWRFERPFAGAPAGAWQLGQK